MSLCTLSQKDAGKKLATNIPQSLSTLTHYKIDLWFVSNDFYAVRNTANFSCEIN